MLVLGSPDTLWSIDDTGDPLTDSVLEGLSMLSEPVALSGPRSSATLRPVRLLLTSLTIDRSPFHPPNLNR